MPRKKPLKIPTPAGLLFLIVLIFAGVYFSEDFTPPWGKAAGFDISPLDVRVTRITDSSFAVSYLTEKPTTGFVEIDSKNFYDIRDKESVPGIYKVHYIQIDNLEPKSKAAYSIISSGTAFRQNAVDLPDKITEPVQILPVNGEIVSKTKQPTKGAVLYLSLDNASPWSLFIYQNTNWLIPLSLIRNSDLNDFFCKKERCGGDLNFKIEVYAEEGSSLVVGRLNDLRTKNNPIIIGEYSDLTIPASIMPETSSPSTAIENVKGAKTEKVEILSPQEQASLPYAKPFIRGLGIPYEEVIISLESKVKQTGKTKVRTDGTWYFTPNTPLDAGSHILVIATKDEKGKEIVLKREFNILKSGESVLSEATVSASITPTAYPTISSPTPTYPLPTTLPTIPVSGSLDETLLFLGSGVFFLLLGLTML